MSSIRLRFEKNLGTAKTKLIAVADLYLEELDEVAASGRKSKKYISDKRKIVDQYIKTFFKIYRRSPWLYLRNEMSKIVTAKNLYNVMVLTFVICLAIGYVTYSLSNEQTNSIYDKFELDFYDALMRHFSLPYQKTVDILNDNGLHLLSSKITISSCLQMVWFIISTVIILGFYASLHVTGKIVSFVDPIADTLRKSKFDRSDLNHIFGVIFMLFLFVTVMDTFWSRVFFSNHGVLTIRSASYDLYRLAFSLPFLQVSILLQLNWMSVKRAYPELLRKN